jgi:hypothetical protein
MFDKIMHRLSAARRRGPILMPDVLPSYCAGFVQTGRGPRRPRRLRDIARHTRGATRARWRIDGFVSPPRPAGATPRQF